MKSVRELFLNDGVDEQVLADLKEVCPCLCRCLCVYACVVCMYAYEHLCLCFYVCICRVFLCEC